MAGKPESMKFCGRIVEVVSSVCIASNRILDLGSNQAPEVWLSVVFTSRRFFLFSSIPGAPQIGKLPSHKSDADEHQAQHLNPEQGAVRHINACFAFAAD